MWSCSQQDRDCRNPGARTWPYDRLELAQLGSGPSYLVEPSHEDGAELAKAAGQDPALRRGTVRSRPKTSKRCQS
jgi:hypothetical protein